MAIGFPIKFKFTNVAFFVELGKLENLENTSWAGLKTKNKLHKHNDESGGTNMQISHIGGRWVLSPSSYIPHYVLQNR